MKIRYFIISALLICLLVGCTKDISQLKTDNSATTKPQLKQIDTIAPNTHVVYDENNPLTILDPYSDTWRATDSLGRTLPLNTEVGKAKSDKFVGLFFWTWHLNSGSRAFNNTEFIKLNPDVKNDYSFKGWGIGRVHFWDEPIYGYYTSKDAYVYRKQAELLAAADVDVIFFDATNGSSTWAPAYKVLMEVFSKAREQGVKTPQIAFMLNLFTPNPDTTIALKQLYKDIYKVSKNQDLWFYWDGKPLIMAYPENLDLSDATQKEISEFFTFRPGQPDYKKLPWMDNQWGWLGIYPQQKYGVNNGKVEQMTVGVAQNWQKDVGLSAMNGENIFGRSYSNKNGFDTRPDAKLYGINFQEQWDYAIAQDPEFILITGWNEWIAGRYKDWMGVKNALPDEYSDEFSRDIEPTKGELKDNYYYQMVANIRKFKGVREERIASAPTTINIFNNTDQWANVQPEYKHYEGSIPIRKELGYGVVMLKNNTGRNDVVSSKVTYDNDNVYFMVDTAANITPKNDPGWMRLYIDTQSQDDKNWEGFEFVVNRVNPGDKATLEASTGGWNWEEVGKIDYTVLGNRLQISIPRQMLGLTAKSPEFNFKWSDNMQEEGNIMDFYVNGEAAPVGRLTFHFQSEKANVKQNSITDNPNFKIIVISACIVILGGVLATLIIFKKRKK